MICAPSTSFFYLSHSSRFFFWSGFFLFGLHLLELLSDRPYLRFLAKHLCHITLRVRRHIRLIPIPVGVLHADDAACSFSERRAKPSAVSSRVSISAA